jgi:hypothetical protein
MSTKTTRSTEEKLAIVLEGLKGQRNKRRGKFIGAEFHRGNLYGFHRTGS